MGFFIPVLDSKMQTALTLFITQKKEPYNVLPEDSQLESFQKSPAAFSNNEVF